jgi:hypothetical protein
MARFIAFCVETLAFRSCVIFKEPDFIIKHYFFQKKCQIHSTILLKRVRNLKSIIFWDMTPCSPLSITRRFGGSYRLHLQGRGLLNYSSILKMEAICSSKTSGTTQRTTRRHIPEDDTLHNHRCENLKSYV